MRYCLECGRWVCNPCVADAANDNNPGVEPVYVASDRELHDIATVVRLARRLRDLGFVQRRIPEWIIDTIYGHDGPILWPDGKPFLTGDELVDDKLVDNTFGEDARRWFVDLLKFADTPPKQRPQKKVLPRLRLLDLALCILDRD